jgi:hypothetical protein
MATWKESVKTIDITFYKDYMRAPEPVEQLRKKAEEFADREFNGRSVDELKPYEIERRNAIVDANLKNWIGEQKLPRKVKSRVRISGDKQRIDIVFAEANESLKLNTPFVDTFINTKDTTTGEFVSYHYAGDIETVFITTEKWAREAIIQFWHMPRLVMTALQFFLGVVDKESLNYVPDPDKIAKLAKTGLVDTEFVVTRISVRPDSDAPESRDMIEIDASGQIPSTILICDKNDYSRVYRAEFYFPTTNQIIFLRECSNFNSEGFPRSITETQWDKNGNFVEKSNYTIIKVELNPSVPDEIFELNPPEGYVVNDSRPPDRRPKNVNYLTNEDVNEILAQVDEASREKDLTALKEFLKHGTWKVRDSALGLITGVARGEELKEIVGTVLKEDKSKQVKEHAKRILERLKKRGKKKRDKQ